MLPDDTPLRGLPLAVIDVETTGLDYATAHVIEIAVVHTANALDAEPRVAFSGRVRPPCPIPARITEITGLTDADVADAPTWAEIADQVVAACKGRVTAAYNAPADYQWIQREMGLIPRDAMGWPWLDLLVLRRAAVSRGSPGRLGQIAADSGILLEAHGATGDAVAAALLAHGLMRAAYRASACFTEAGGARAAEERRRRSRWSDNGDEGDDALSPVETLGPFLRWQRAAALYQEREYATYRMREGDRTPPRSDWHVLEGVEPIMWSVPTPTRRHDCGVEVTLRIARDGSVSMTAPNGEPHICPHDDDVPF